ncbi:hypothetical protein BDZ85DRAFT_277640 [Elsinoe ampelina]|uniref:Uncharacterized protein n=1 Tax=Elsinoe ampelina TaxID=302913 RepID=A0A6A6GPV8_9PEZI|nr:hypothetical protein BDZ85DRAFT_277640 [Elsinoe ampelina]
MRNRNRRSAARTSSPAPVPVAESNNVTSEQPMFNLDDVPESNHGSGHTLPSMLPLPPPNSRQPRSPYTLPFTDTRSQNHMTFAERNQRRQPSDRYDSHPEPSSTQVSPSRSPRRLALSRHPIQDSAAPPRLERGANERTQGRWPRPPTPPQRTPALGPLTTLRRSITTREPRRASQRFPPFSRQYGNQRSVSSPALFGGANSDDLLALWSGEATLTIDRDLDSRPLGSNGLAPVIAPDEFAAGMQTTPPLDIPIHGRCSRVSRAPRSDSPRPDLLDEGPTMIRDMFTGRIREMQAQDPPLTPPGVFTMSPLPSPSQQISRVNEGLDPARISGFDNDSPHSARRSRPVTPPLASVGYRQPRNQRRSRLSVEHPQDISGTGDASDSRSSPPPSSRNRRYAQGEEGSSQQDRSTVRHHHGIRTALGAPVEPVTTTPSPEPRLLNAGIETISASPPNDMMTETLELPAKWSPQVGPVHNEQGLDTATEPNQPGQPSRSSASRRPFENIMPAAASTSRPRIDQDKKSDPRIARANEHSTADQHHDGSEVNHAHSTLSRPSTSRGHTAPATATVTPLPATNGSQSARAHKALPEPPAGEARFVPRHLHEANSNTLHDPAFDRYYSPETRVLEAAGLERPHISQIRAFQGATLTDTRRPNRTGILPLRPTRPSSLTEGLREHERITALAASATEAIPSRHSSVSGSDTEDRARPSHGHRRGLSDISTASDTTVRDTYSNSKDDSSSTVAANDTALAPLGTVNVRQGSSRRQQHNFRSAVSEGSSETSPATGQSTSSFASQQGFESTTTPESDAELYSRDFRSVTAQSASRIVRGRADSTASSSSIEPRQGDLHGPTSWNRGGQVSYPPVFLPLDHPSDQYVAVSLNTNTTTHDPNDDSDALGDNLGRGQSDCDGRGQGYARPSSATADRSETRHTPTSRQRLFGSKPPLDGETSLPRSPTSPNHTTFTPLPSTPLSPTTLPSALCPHCHSTGSFKVSCTSCSDDRIVAIYCLHCLESGHYKLSCKRCWGTRIIAKFCGICDEDRREELRCVCVGGEPLMQGERVKREDRENRENRENRVVEDEGVRGPGEENQREEREQDGGGAVNEGDEAWDGYDDDDEESKGETEDEEEEDG